MAGARQGAPGATSAPWKLKTIACASGPNGGLPAQQRRQTRCDEDLQGSCFMHSCPWRFRHIHFRTRFNAEVKALEQASEREVRHLQSVGNPGARSPPGAERDELKMPPGGVHLSVGGQESLGHELLRVTPHPRVSVELPSVDVETGAFGDVIAAHVAVLHGFVRD
nr:Os09g0441250 [Ipomoea batatas]GME21041.1 Os09g0441250 [Ipomoea batatas]